jgi:predicted NUDIX family NTP pyrophosphohydrolase
MTQKESAGLVIFRRRAGRVEVLLGHPGGPFWQARHDGAWTIPKGGMHAGEQPLDTAVREFREETGLDAVGPFLPLGQITQRSGKIVWAWAFEGDCDPARLTSIHTTTEWPPRSGRYIDIPEIERADFFTILEARRVINIAQAELLDRLEEILNDRIGGTEGLKT